jgi:hypothetical protein
LARFLKSHGRSNRAWLSGSEDPSPWGWESRPTKLPRARMVDLSLRNRKQQWPAPVAGFGAPKTGIDSRPLGINLVLLHDSDERLRPKSPAIPGVTNRRAFNFPAQGLPTSNSLVNCPKGALSEDLHRTILSVHNACLAPLDDGSSFHFGFFCIVPEQLFSPGLIVSQSRGWPHANNRRRNQRLVRRCSSSAWYLPRGTSARETLRGQPIAD